MPELRAFSVAANREACGVSCSEFGVCVGHVPLLEQAHGSWTVRSIAELNDELTVCYRLPVDITSKTSALALVAHAFNRGDLAMAAIAAVQMQFPNPPPVAKGVESANEVMRRAAELHRSGLLKWDPDKHPRTGTPPNAGWFAPVPQSSDQYTPGVSTAATDPPCQFIGFVGTLCLYHCGGSSFITTPGPICFSRVFPTFPGAKQWGDNPMLGE